MRWEGKGEEEEEEVVVVVVVRALSHCLEAKADLFPLWAGYATFAPSRARLNLPRIAGSSCWKC